MIVAATLGEGCNPTDLYTASAAFNVASKLAVANVIPEMWILICSGNFAFHIPVR